MKTITSSLVTLLVAIGTASAFDGHKTTSNPPITLRPKSRSPARSARYTKFPKALFKGSISV